MQVRHRPLDEAYAPAFIDAVVVKVPYRSPNFSWFAEVTSIPIY